MKPTRPVRHWLTADERLRRSLARQAPTASLNNAAPVTAKQKPNPRCPGCTLRMTLRNSRHGPFWGCTAYPTCTTTRPLHKAGTA